MKETYEKLKAAIRSRDFGAIIAMSGPTRGELKVNQPVSRKPCAKLGEVTRLIGCMSCKGRVNIKVYQCSEFGECTTGRSMDKLACCNGCESYES